MKLLDYHQPCTFNNLETLSKVFIEEFFSPWCMEELKDDINQFQQKEEETLYDAWMRFQEYLKACPHHGFTPEQVAKYFAEGLDQDTTMMVN
ncbi:unnamed protein product [Linum trigynum]|uniref:Retrotransposon gag domain-containing protein n=1 Tax=Linum trigynum TaxID=586398 RepID=A0AAV2CYT6_9ROSI